MAHCNICGVETKNGKCCKSCEADKQRIDAHNEAEHKDTTKFLIGLPSHLFFYGLKHLLLDKDRTGTTLNDFLLYTDNNNGAPVWQRLKDYRCGREGDRWDTNPLLATN